MACRIPQIAEMNRIPISSSRAAVVALSVVGAAATLYGLGWLLQKALVALPEWVTRRWD